MLRINKFIEILKREGFRTEIIEKNFAEIHLNRILSNNDLMSLYLFCDENKAELFDEDIMTEIFIYGLEDMPIENLLCHEVICDREKGLIGISVDEENFLESLEKLAISVEKIDKMIERKREEKIYGRIN